MQHFLTQTTNQTRHYCTVPSQFFRLIPFCWKYLFICSLFNEAVSDAGYTASNDITVGKK
jgi:hypothetical protein